MNSTIVFTQRRCVNSICWVNGHYSYSIYSGAWNISSPLKDPCSGPEYCKFKQQTTIKHGTGPKLMFCRQVLEGTQLYWSLWSYIQFSIAWNITTYIKTMSYHVHRTIHYLFLTRTVQRSIRVMNSYPIASMRPGKDLTVEEQRKIAELSFAGFKYQKYQNIYIGRSAVRNNLQRGQEYNKKRHNPCRNPKTTLRVRKAILRWAVKTDDACLRKL